MKTAMIAALPIAIATSLTLSGEVSLPSLYEAAPHAPITHSSAPAMGPPSAVAEASRTTPSAGFSWPLASHHVLRTFDPPAVKWEAGHRGVDLASPTGAEVRAPAEGVVTFSGVVAGKGVVTIRHPQGFDTTYEPLEYRVPKGTRVSRGMRIGVLTDGHLKDGHCPQVCLHWGYRVAKDEYRNPLELIGLIRPLLLPPL